MVAAGRVIREKDSLLGDVVTCEVQYAHEDKILRHRQVFPVEQEHTAWVPTRSLILRSMFEAIARNKDWS